MAVDMLEEESIYRLIPVEAPEPEKKSMYRSKHIATLPPSYSTFGTAGTSKKVANPGGVESIFDEAGGKHKAKKANASMGAAFGPSVDPKQFLKRSSAQSGPAAVAVAATPRKDQVQPFQRTAQQQSMKRPAVPKATDRPVMGLTTDKNFVVSNAVDTILAPPRKQLDAPPNMTQTKVFGKVPAYLKKIKGETRREQQQKADDERSRTVDPLAPKLRLMSEGEKQELMRSLKGRWEVLNKRYQSLTFSMDTMTKVARKEKEEADLEKLEKALSRLSGKKHIFVHDNIGAGWDALGIKGVDAKAATS